MRRLLNILVAAILAILLVILGVVYGRDLLLPPIAPTATLGFLPPGVTPVTPLPFGTVPVSPPRRSLKPPPL